ncbi:PP2C family protein-serine/threonine phosphatase [Streptacidiphilus sp. PB12-B1b]|uniref:PP2C family protein-serine/threonine phosphatase n=1 Tax=Streptacidiphilus sp. PB12-B1b TaxID=2705012 RepID=UPI001CDC6D96|nr:PP2C family protein-serine/threonine phosphatase [Streptacidiphilus sp. PB12-B1b]
MQQPSEDHDSGSAALAPSSSLRLRDDAALLQAPFRLRVLTPLTAMLLVVFFDLVSGPDTYLASLMSVVPPLAALTLYPLEVVLTSALGLIGLVGLSRYDGLDDSHDHRLFLGTLIAYAALTVAGAVISQLRVERSRHLVAVSTVAEAAQLALLRPPGPHVGGILLAARYVSAADSAQIGGDLYAVLDTPYGVRAVIGDVRGKGLGAVQAASVVLGAFREAAYDEPELVGVARRLESSVVRHVPSGEFTTALLVGLSCPETVELVHLGHVAPLRISPDGSVAVLYPPDPWVPLGLGAMAVGSPRPWTVPFGPGDVLLLCTDGVVEARSHEDGRFYPLEERAPALTAGSSADLEAAVARVYADLLRHTGGELRDDAVLLLLARDGEPAALEPGAD